MMSTNPYPPTFIIDGVDFTGMVAYDGFDWERNDIEAETAGRHTLDVLMKRAVLADKRGLVVTPIRSPFSRSRELALALHKTYLTITYLDQEDGVITKQFYGTQVRSKIHGRLHGVTYSTIQPFTLVEV